MCACVRAPVQVDSLGDAIVQQEDGCLRQQGGRTGSDIMHSYLGEADDLPPTPQKGILLDKHLGAWRACTHVHTLILFTASGIPGQ